MNIFAALDIPSAVRIMTLYLISKAHDHTQKIYRIPLNHNGHSAFSNFFKAKKRKTFSFFYDKVHGEVRTECSTRNRRSDIVVVGWIKKMDLVFDPTLRQETNDPGQDIYIWDIFPQIRRKNSQLRGFSKFPKKFNKCKTTIFVCYLIKLLGNYSKMMKIFKSYSRYTSDPYTIIILNIPKTSKFEIVYINNISRFLYQNLLFYSHNLSTRLNIDTNYISNF